MKCIVTGATGFIGSYLCDYLLKRNYMVIALSRHFSEEFRKKFDGAVFLEKDVLDDSLANVKLSADIVIHLASANDIISKDARKGFELSVLGTKNMLDFAANNNIKRFIYFSTLQVYGNELEGEISESTQTNPQNDYALNHLFAEQYVKMYSVKEKLIGMVVRPSNIFGRFTFPEIKRWTLVPACFCQEVFHSQKISLYSSGLQQRNFVSLENISRACEILSNNFPDNYEVFNFASRTNLSILDVARIVKDIYESEYHREVKLEINSDLPKKPNYFHISLDKLTNFGFLEDNRYNLKIEILEIFKFLEK